MDCERNVAVRAVWDVIAFAASVASSIAFAVEHEEDTVSLAQGLGDACTQERAEIGVALTLHIYQKIRIVRTWLTILDLVKRCVVSGGIVAHTTMIPETKKKQIRKNASRDGERLFCMSCIRA